MQKERSMNEKVIVEELLLYFHPQASLSLLSTHTLPSQGGCRWNYTNFQEAVKAGLFHKERQASSWGRPHHRQEQHPSQWGRVPQGKQSRAGDSNRFHQQSSHPQAKNKPDPKSVQQSQITTWEYAWKWVHLQHRSAQGAWAKLEWSSWSKEKVSFG